MRKLSAVLAAVMITAAACGGSGSGSVADNAIAKAIEAETGQPVDVQQNGDGLTVQTDDGSITFGSDGNEVAVTDADGNDFSFNSGTDVPADFPLPVPDNVDISSATTFEMPEGKSFGLIFDFDPSRYDEMTQIYKDALNSHGLTVEDSGGGPDGIVIIGSSDALNIIVSIDNYGDYWECSISWTPV